LGQLALRPRSSTPNCHWPHGWDFAGERARPGCRFRRRATNRPECARPRAQQRGTTVRHRIGECALPSGHGCGRGRPHSAPGHRHFCRRRGDESLTKNWGRNI
jgi:hypothetical protein